MIIKKHSSSMRFWSVVGLSFAVLIAAFQTDTWARMLFATQCHQDPLRSFWVDELPMAVCARCLGFYSLLAVNWLLFFLARPSFTFTQKVFITLVALFLNLLDYLLNAFGWWTNTLESRFFAGMLLAFPIALFLTESLLKPKTLTSEKAQNF